MIKSSFNTFSKIRFLGLFFQKEICISQKANIQDDPKSGVSVVPWEAAVCSTHVLSRCLQTWRFCAAPSPGSAFVNRCAWWHFAVTAPLGEMFQVLTEPCGSLTGLLVSAPQGQGGGTCPKLALASEGTEAKCPFRRAAGRADGSEAK